MRVNLTRDIIFVALVLLPAAAMAGSNSTSSGGLSDDIRSIEDMCKLADTLPTKRQCQRPSCWKVLPKQNKRYCCCAAKASGWTFEGIKECHADMECPEDIPAHLMRTAPSLREQLSYQSKLSACSQQCVNQCAVQSFMHAQAQQFQQLQKEFETGSESAAAAAAAGGEETAADGEEGDQSMADAADAVEAFIELSTGHMVRSLAQDRCEDKCIENCLANVMPSVSLSVLLEEGAVKSDFKAELESIRRHIKEMRAEHEHAAAAEKGTIDGNTGEHIVAPTYSNPRFSGVSSKVSTAASSEASAHAESKAHAGAKAGDGGAQWWANPPPWWLPPPPEWGSPPPSIYSSFYSPYNMPMPSQLSPAHNMYPAYSPQPLPY
mmetsp:Transcript_10757/g.34208  ORF Transcript_10757/g.34208 Transcript_10757/m.34208 type:complete len:378 (-) Transcript_10757:45-1178(-)